MAQTDIIARLQLKAEQFTSEAGQAMTRLKEVSRAAAADVRREFNGAFAEVQRTAQTALQMPRTTGGGLDLSQEIAQLKAQEVAAQNSAQAQRELSAAAAAVAARGGETAAVQRLMADAAMVAERASVEEATAIRAKITAYEELQVQLAQTVSGTRRLTEEEQKHIVSAASNRTGMVNLGQQFTDFAVQVSTGQSAATAFAQQLPQAAFAASQMGGALGAVGTFLTGPWGTALTIATVVATPLISKLLEGKEAADAAKKATEELANTVGNIGTFFDTATGKIKETNAALREYALLSRDKEKRELVDQNRAAAGEGRGLLARTLRDRNPVFAERGLAQNQVKDINFDIQRVFDGGPNRKGIDEELRKIASSTSSNAAEAAKLLEIRARYYENEKKIQTLEKERRSIETGVLDGSLITGKPPKERKGPKPKKPRDFSRSDDAAEQAITAINAEWDDQPRLIDRARLATLKLDNLTEQLGKRKLTPEVQKLLGLIDQARESIKNGMDRPFREFVEAQRESLEVGKLVLAGRDADAEALQNVLRLQERMGPLNEQQVQQVYRLAQQHQAINRLLEDQRRIVGIYEGAWGGVLDQVDGVFAKIQGNAGGVVGVVQKLQRDLLSNALFGGVDREIEDYIRQATGKRTPAEILQDQAKGAGVALHDSVADASDALRSFIDAVTDASLRIKGVDPTAARAAAGFAAAGGLGVLGGIGAGLYGANDNDIVVNGRKPGAAEALGLVRPSGVIDTAVDGILKRIDETFGIKIPKVLADGLKSNVKTIAEGAALGGIGGSVFSALGGGKSDKTASGIGGILGEYGGKELGKTITKEIGGSLGKTLGGFAGPLGAIAGGILGNVVGGLFKKTERGSAQINSVDQAAVVNGNYSAVQSDLGGLATNVQTGIRQIADALGADVGNFAVSINKYKDSYRVDPSGGTSVGGKYGTNDGVLKFDNDPEGAVRAAIANALSDGAIKGISDASQRILASGKDLESAINKAVLIEAIPKTLKKMLDPVGAAIDDLNREWKKTVAALKEGGASTEQMAQAQQLYNLQLDQVKASTASASATLKDFASSLKLGSNSPYSLRDQEQEALAKLQPFLDQIAQGKSIDQSAYQSTANTAIDIERQIYGSTKQFFDFLDLIQGETNKAISSIDNATPVTAAVESPFAKATADSAASTAKNTSTANDLLDQVSQLLQRNNELLAQLGTGSANDGGFLSSSRNFA